MSILQGKYDATLRDYKKGKFLLETRPSQLLPVSARSGTKDPSSPASSSSNLESQQKRILDKVWSAVERVIGEMKNILISQLRDPSRTVEEQEKTLEYARLQ